MRSVVMKRMMLAAAMLALAACAGPRYYGDDYSSLYRRSEVHVAASQGPVPLLLRGEPFPGLDPSRLAGATLTAMASAGALWPIRLTTGDPGPRSVDYRIIVAFGQPSVGGNGLCAQPDAPFAREPGLAATAAFCIGDRLLSTVRGRRDEPVAGPEDPRFAAFVRGLTDAMLPTINPRALDCGARPINC